MTTRGDTYLIRVRAETEQAEGALEGLADTVGDVADAGDDVNTGAQRATEGVGGLNRSMLTGILTGGILGGVLGGILGSTLDLARGNGLLSESLLGVNDGVNRLIASLIVAANLEENLGTISQGLNTAADVVDAGVERDSGRPFEDRYEAIVLGGFTAVGSAVGGGIAATLDLFGAEQLAADLRYAVDQAGRGQQRTVAGETGDYGLIGNILVDAFPSLADPDDPRGGSPPPALPGGSAIPAPSPPPALPGAPTLPFNALPSTLGPSGGFNTPRGGEGVQTTINNITINTTDDPRRIQQAIQQALANPTQRRNTP